MWIKTKKCKQSLCMRRRDCNLPLIMTLFPLLSFNPVIVYPIRTVFSNKCPTIVIKEANSNKVLSPTSLSSQARSLTDDEIEKLNKGSYILFYF